MARLESKAPDCTSEGIYFPKVSNYEQTRHRDNALIDHDLQRKMPLGVPAASGAQK